MGEFEEITKRSSAGPSTKASSKAPLPKPKPLSAEDTAFVNVAKASLHAAQHWFDRGTAALDAKRAIDWRTIAGNVFSHLDEASSVLGRTQAGRAQLGAQIDETTRAMETFLVRMTPHVSAAETGAYQGVVARLRHTESAIRFALDLPAEHARGRHRSANMPDDVYESQALSATLDLTAYTARSTLERVRNSTDPKVYRPLILATAATLQKDLTYAVSVFNAYGGKDKQRVFAAKIQAASVPLAGLQRFIENRVNNADLQQQFSPIAVRIDELRSGVGLPDLGSIEIATTNNQVRSHNNEVAEIDDAQKRLFIAIDDLESKITLGANRFFQFAQLEDPPSPGSMWAELASGLLISLLSNIVGFGVGRVLKGLGGTLVAHEVAVKGNKVVGTGGKTSVDTVSDTVEGVSAGAGSDTAQSWAGVVQNAMSTASGKQDRIKDAVLFHEALLEGKQAIGVELKRAISTRIHDNSISASEIYSLAADVQRQAVTAKERTYEHASRDFALFLARRGLGGVERNKEQKEVSKIGTAHDYFFGGDLHRAGKRDGTDGIARVAIDLGPSGHTIRGFELAGMNKTMAEAVLGSASRRIAKLGLPTEIEISPSWSQHKFTLVIDESSALRVSSSWREFMPGVPVLEDVANRYGTPEKAWTAIQGDIIPDTVKVG